MSAKIFGKRAARLALLLLGMTLAGGRLTADPFATDGETPPLRQAIHAGASLERSHSWLKAIDHYEQALEEWPENKELQYGLRRSKVHFGIDRRYADRSFRTALVVKSRRDALDLFDEVLEQVRSHFVDPLSSTSFVAHGTESFYLSLTSDKFLEHNLPNADTERIRKLRTILREEYWNKPVADRRDARATVAEVCDLARSLVGLSSGPVVMEYVFGGCNALDDYSNFLTPNRLDDLYGNIEGEFVGLGIEMKAEAGQGLLLVDVLPESPAEEGGLRPGEHIVAIDGRDCRKMTTDEAAGLLRGPSGSRVTLDIEDAAAKSTRTRTFARREVQVKSIPVAKMIDRDRGIGYIRMTGFQKTSAAELDAALDELQRQGLRALIWDVRGNPGGLLTAAVEVLDRFVEEGVLVSTKGRTSDQNWSYSAHRPGTWRLPLVLIVDGDSASASEIVAGAVHDHRRGTIVGRKTFGKWSVQSIFPVRGSTGLRLTTAKFYSPHGRTLGKVGVRPDVVVELEATDGKARTTFYRGSSGGDLADDQDLKRAQEVLRRQLAGR